MGKHYFTPVVDFAWLEDGRVVLFELGGGICGSGFPDYDYSHNESIRHLMLRSLAKRVKNVFLVNVAENILREILADDFLKSLGNVYCFNNLNNFVAHIRGNPAAAQDAVVVIDRLSKDITMMEDDYARILVSNGIQVPVVNADSYKFYDNKVFFPLLFQAESQQSLITRTFIINKESATHSLAEIAKSNIKQFVLKPALSSHAKGTLIVEGHQLAEVVELITHKNRTGVDRLVLSEVNKKNLIELMDCIVDDNCTFIVRELVVPKPVQLKDNTYRCAGRSVYVACYDDVSDEVKLEHIASFWQPAAKPVDAKENVSHETLISTDHVRFSPTRTMQNFFRVSPSELEEYKQSYKNLTDLDADQLTQILPQLDKIMLYLIKQVARQKPHQLIEDVHRQSSAKSVLKEYLQHRMHHMLVHVSEPLLHLLKPRMRTFNNFIIVQIIFDLMIFKHLPTEQTLQAYLYVELNKFNAQSIREVNKELELFASAFLALPNQGREIYKSFMTKVNCKLLLHMISTCEKISIREENLAQEAHKRAFQAYKDSNFGLALTEWQKMFDTLNKCNPNSQKMINCYTNLVTCLCALKEFKKAIGLCHEGINRCNQLNLSADNLEAKMRECIKLAEAQEPAKSTVSSLTI